jgi:hypothetical protein
MPRLEAYYHDGNTGQESTVRKDVTAATNLTENIRNRMGNNEQIKEVRQRLWLNENNPHLWDGDIDD